jgi:hypothetical protein
MAPEVNLKLWVFNRTLTMLQYILYIITTTTVEEEEVDIEDILIVHNVSYHEEVGAEVFI